MIQVSVTVEARNEANTAPHPTINLTDKTFAVEFQKVRNLFGSGEFSVRSADTALISALDYGTVVLFRVDGIARFAGRIRSKKPVLASVGDEDIEMTQYLCVDLAEDFTDSVVQPSPVACDLVPSTDTRYFSVFGYDFDPVFYPGFETAKVIAVQGWGSTFYTGSPAGWTDPTALWVWASSGDEDNAPPGRCIVRQSFLVEAGPKYLEWSADNDAKLYINGKEMQSGGDWRRKEVVEFTTTDNFLTLAWDAVNAPDDGPPGGNPGAVIASMRRLNAEGPILWNTGNDYRFNYSGPGGALVQALSLMVLPYPPVTPGVTPGRTFRLAQESNTLVADVWDTRQATWPTVDIYDPTGAAWVMLPELPFRYFEDTVTDVLAQLCETWCDFKVWPEGKQLWLYAKGELTSTCPIPLIVGYSTAGAANPELVNVVDLSWDVTRPKFTALGVRTADRWIRVGAGNRWSALRLEQVTDVTVATQIANAMLALYGIEYKTAAFEYVPLDTGDLPFVAFDVHDQWVIPGPESVDSGTMQDIQSITVTSDEDGTASFVVEVGPPVKAAIAWLEAAIRRVGGGTLDGRAMAASGSTRSPTDRQIRTVRVTAGGAAHVLASAPSAAQGTVSVAPCGFVGRVVSLRLVGQSSTGTSTVTVIAGGTTYTLTGSGEGNIAYVPVNDSWNISTTITVTLVTVKHTNLHVYADVADI